MIEKELEPGLIQRLAYSKDLYQYSRHLQSLQHNVALAEALVLADAAIESLLRTLLEYNNIQHRDKDDFHTLISKMKDIKVCNEMEFLPLKQLHTARNEVQHRYLIPVESQVDQYITNAIIRSDEITMSLLNTSWTLVSMSELFLDPITKVLYQKAEETYTSGMYKESIIYLVATFETAKFLEQTRIFGSMITMDVVTPDEDEEDEIDELARYCKKIHDEVEVIKLRLDYKEYRRYCDIAINVLSPEFTYDISPKDFNTKLGYEEGHTILYNHWEEKLSKGTMLYNWSEIDSDPTILESIKKDWLPFAFQFVEKSILHWQRVSRKGILEFLSESKKIVPEHQGSQSNDS